MLSETSNNDSILIKKLKKYFDFEENILKEFIETEPCLIFRHDMDKITSDIFSQFIKDEIENDCASTYFFLKWQINSYGKQIYNFASDLREIGLHSEARPMLTVGLAPYLKIVQGQYRRNLIRQTHYFAKRKFKVEGHAPHASNNYLGFNNSTDWDIIESASTGTGLKYISSWRIPARTVNGENFAKSEGCYFQKFNDEKVLVIPTSWDDKYLSQYGKNKTKHSIDEAFESIIVEFDFSVKKGFPFVMNIHPWYWLNKTLDTLKLKRMLINYALQNNIPIKTMADFANKTIENPRL